ncbi:hypothetical protein G7Z17_g11821 [Cylindrodendrum hubeiense]|uniref:Uncharacterized protein n=1 Tax=Cylindrodendrum hubeiense TaxID=595255 RepID=A0A9P5GV78_9HYPO|nr:hypothetical protein G7Z17_g11821 [Cylindrodendrum hubeiense]
MNQTTLTLGSQGLALFDPDVVKTRVAEVTLNMKTMEEALKKMRRGAIDKAVEAGYTPSAREKVSGWSNRYVEMANQIQDVRTDADRFKAMDARLIETANAADKARQPMSAPRDGFLQVIVRLGRNQHEFQQALEALGASGTLTPEVQKALDAAAHAAEAELHGVDCTQPSQLLGFKSSRPPPKVLDLESRVSQLEHELEAARQDIKVKAGSIDILSRGRDRLEEDLAAEKATVRRLKFEAAQSAAGVARVDGVVQEQRIEITTIRLDLEDKSQELNACLEALSERDADLTTANTKLGARDLEIAAHRDVLRDRNEKLRDSAQQLKAVREELGDSIRQLEQAREEMEDSSRQLKEVREDLQSREDRLRSSALDLKQIREELVIQGQESARELTEVRSDLRDREQEIRDATRQLTEAWGDMSKQGRESAHELTEARSALRDREEEVMSVTRQLTNVQQELHGSTQQLTQVQSDLKDCEERLRDSTRELAAFRKDLQDSAQEIATVREQLRDSTRQVTDVQVRSQELEKTLQCSAVALASSRSETAEARRVGMGKTDAAVSLMSMAGVGTELHLQTLLKRVSEDPFSETGSEASKSWRMLPSLSSAESLKQTADTRGAGAIMLDALATILSGDVPRLWGVLCALNEALKDAIYCPLIVVRMLLEAFAELMPRSELHLVHRIAMGIVATYLGSIWPLTMSRVSRVLRAIKASDSKAAEVVKGLYTDEPAFDNSMQSDQGLILGFNYQPRGVLIVHPENRTVQWVDQIKASSGNLKTEVSTLSRLFQILSLSHHHHHNNNSNNNHHHHHNDDKMPKDNRNRSNNRQEPYGRGQSRGRPTNVSDANNTAVGGGRRGGPAREQSAASQPGTQLVHRSPRDVQVPTMMLGGLRPGGDPLLVVPTLDTDVFVDKSGQVRAALPVNRRQGGGRQDELAAPFPNIEGAYEFTTRHLNSIAHLAGQVALNSDDGKVAGMIYPVNNKTWASCRKKGMEIRTLQHSVETLSLNRNVARCPSRVLEVLEDRDEEIEEDVPPAGQSAGAQTDGPKCAKCGSSSHKLSWCLSCNEKGIMDGCPRCNTLEHEVKDCPVISKMQPREQVNELLYGRANMPPFNGKPWWLQFSAFIEGMPNPALPRAFPWSSSFAKAMRKDVAKLQLALDRHSDRNKLPVDPATKDWETAKTTVFKSKARASAEKLASRSAAVDKLHTFMAGVIREDPSVLATAADRGANFARVQQQALPTDREPAPAFNLDDEALEDRLERPSSPEFDVGSGMGQEDEYMTGQ